MAEVRSNETTLGIGEQPARGSDPTSGQVMEYNSLTAFGPTIGTTPRIPVSASRGNRKGTITSLGSAPAFETDLTLSTALPILGSFFFVVGTNLDLRFIAAPVTATDYTVPALTAAQAAKLQFVANGGKSILRAKGYATAANNGIKLLTADPAPAATALQVSGLTAEASPPTNAELAIAGIRANADDLALAIAAGPPRIATLSSGNGVGTAIDFTTLGLTVGQIVRIGGAAVGNQFSSVGLGRVLTIAAGQITLDRLDAALVADAGAGKEIDLLFGYFYRDVPRSSSEFIEQYLQFEATYPNLGPAGETRYQYAIDNLANELAISLPTEDKATFTASFVGTDTPPPENSRRSWGSSIINPVSTEAFNTTSDVARLRAFDTDETGLTTDFADITFTISNGVTPQPVVGTLGARFLNTTNFTISMTGAVLFTNQDVLDRARNNTTVGFDLMVANDDGAIALDVPECTLNVDSFNFPVNEVAQLNTTLSAFESTFGYTLSASVFNYLPDAA